MREKSFGGKEVFEIGLTLRKRLQRKLLCENDFEKKNISFGGHNELRGKQIATLN